MGLLFFVIFFYPKGQNYNESDYSSILRTTNNKGVNFMAPRGIMSESLKYEIAKELGVSDTVQREGWGSVSSRDCGRMVQKAIEIAEKSLQQR